MVILRKIVRYLAPSKGGIVLVVLLSILTSFSGAVSIYSVLPLLNEIFTADKAVSAHRQSSFNADVEKSPVADPTGASESGTVIDTDALQHKITEWYTGVFYADTKQKTLLNICLFLVAAFAVKNLLLYINTQVIYRIQTKATKKLRDDVFHSIIEMHLDYFNKQRVGGLMNHVYNDVQNVQNSISLAFINFIQNPFSIFVYVGVLLVLSWKLTLFAFGISLVILLVIRVIGQKIKNLSKVFRARMGDMNSVLQEKFNGIKVIKSSAFEEVEIERFKSFTSDFRKLDMKIRRLHNITGPLNETLLVFAVAMVLWFGGLQVFEGAMSANELIVFAFSLYSAMGPMKMLGEANSKIQEGMASAERLFEVIEAEPLVRNGTRPITGFNEAIRFEDVSFKYNKLPEATNILDHVSFEIRKGEMLALVGESGSGKSTVVDLLLRFYDVDSGRITIDGIDIREFDFKQLRRMIGVVGQEVVLFNDTIGQNISYGLHDQMERSQIERAARLANAHDFIQAKAFQYETIVGDRGVQLSGGQRQRLAIARAMVKNPDLLIFDEATSALDNESEKVVQEAIDHALEDRTALVVAHRLSTIKNADRIIVLQKGTVAESGTHQELLEKRGLYKMYHDIQFSSKISTGQL